MVCTSCLHDACAILLNRFIVEQVAKACGICFGQYPKSHPNHAGALFVMRLVQGGPADASEQVRHVCAAAEPS